MDEKARVESVRISYAKDQIEVLWKDGHGSRFHNKWLRFNCHCNNCYRFIVGQQRINCSLFPDDFPIIDAKVNKDEDQLYVEFNGEVCANHNTVLPLAFLRRNCYCDRCLHKLIDDRKMHFIKPGEFKLQPLDYSTVKGTDGGLFKVLKAVMEVGICYLRGVPTDEEFLEEFAVTIGPLVDSTYGRKFMIHDKGVKDSVTNTREYLTFHTDQAHYESELGVQFFQCLQFDECIEGGESIVADMFQAAEILRQESPDDFRVLTRVPCTFATIDYKRQNPAYYETRKPVIEVDYDDQIVAVHFNTGLDATLRVRENCVMPFYNAHKKLWKIITRPELRFTHRMVPGDMLVFNNRRVAHGREAFVPHGGTRLLQSAYVNVEDFRSKYMVLGRKLGHDVTPTKIGNRSSI
uniref:Gamma-butyrobetaine dioxygenase-like n=1 Tax=Phallusia mammillata TaxID=59560 RepID=A0A6F9D804_9ASCI|nr:gamma-butyrobetaine dioxygenase-like [Phallusia mammillata]